MSIRYLNEGQSAATDSWKPDWRPLHCRHRARGERSRHRSATFAAASPSSFSSSAFPVPAPVTLLPRPTHRSLSTSWSVLRYKRPIVTELAVVRSVGLKLQVNDSPQADPLPEPLRRGLPSRCSPRCRRKRVRLAADVVTRSQAAGEPAYRFAAEVFLAQGPCARRDTR